MTTLRLFPLIIAGVLVIVSRNAVVAADASVAARATNEIGLDLYRSLAGGDDNLCLSPYAIENALAMTLSGAAGQTQAEMARVIHTQAPEEMVHASFSALRRDLAGIVEKSMSRAEEAKKHDSSADPITLAIASRVFAQTGFEFRPGFLTLVKERYDAPLALVDFDGGASAATGRINSWVAEKTGNRILDLIPAGALDSRTRLVLANALYFKARWSTPFSAEQTKPRPFRVRGETAVTVPTMFAHEEFFDYAKRDGYTAVSVPYSESELQFLILLPDEAKGIRALEKEISAASLARLAKLEPRRLSLYLPKFKIEPPALDLGAALQSLGMQTACDRPPGSANFEGMAPRKPNEHLFLSAIFHKSYVAVDEVGTEAAAANALPVTVYSAELLGKKPKPLVVRVDRPFLYAIQHVPSGACLFIGRVTDPR